MPETQTKRLIAANHWSLKVGFLAGVVLGGFLLIGELLSVPMIAAIVVSVLPGEQCETLLGMAGGGVPWAGIIVVMLLVAPVMIGQVAAAKILGSVIDKVPGK